MTGERIFELIAAFGADPASWPDAEHEAGAAALKADPERYADALAAALILDDVLEAIPQPVPSARLAERILVDAPQASVRTSIGVSKTSGRTLKNLFGMRDSLWPLRAAMASLVTGVVVGYGAMAATLNNGLDADEIFYMAIDGGYDMDFEEDEP